MSNNISYDFLRLNEVFPVRRKFELHILHYNKSVCTCLSILTTAID